MDYDIVFNGLVIEPLSKTITEAHIDEHSTVSILAKKISRG